MSDPWTPPLDYPGHPDEHALKMKALEGRIDPDDKRPFVYLIAHMMGAHDPEPPLFCQWATRRDGLTGRRFRKLLKEKMQHLHDSIADSERAHFAPAPREMVRTQQLSDYILPPPPIPHFTQEYKDRSIFDPPERDA